MPFSFSYMFVTNYRYCFIDHKINFVKIYCQLCLRSSTWSVEDRVRQTGLHTILLRTYVI